jgi:hypothetical protein
VKEHRIPLTAAEAALLAQIDLSPLHRKHAAHLAAQEPIRELLRSLGARNAIPPQRLRYWDDPEFNLGKTSGSRKQMFERNGCCGEDIYAHPHFIKHLRYFLLGADLPPDLIRAFEERVRNPSLVSSAEAIELGATARQLVRRHGLDPSEACEEFFKLALDLDLGLEHARRIRCAVKEAFIAYRRC